MYVTLQVGGGAGTSGGSKVESFFVASTSTKLYNKWYMCERGKQIWKKDMDEGKFRFEARIIRYDHGLWRYGYVNPVDSDWGAKSIFC